jgi:hypothetical protein
VLKRALNNLPQIYLYEVYKSNLDITLKIKDEYLPRYFLKIKKALSISV